METNFLAFTSSSRSRRQPQTPSHPLIISSRCTLLSFAKTQLASVLLLLLILAGPYLPLRLLLMLTNSSSSSSSNSSPLLFLRGPTRSPPSFRTLTQSPSSTAQSTVPLPVHAATSSSVTGTATAPSPTPAQGPSSSAALAARLSLTRAWWPTTPGPSTGSCHHPLRRLRLLPGTFYLVLVCCV